MSNFAFLTTEWPDVSEAATKCESLAYGDPRTACIYARRALELAVRWAYKHDPALRLPYQEHLSALIYEPTYRKNVEPAVFAKARVIKDLGNLAVHSTKPIRQFDAYTAAKELFHVLFWHARTYGRTKRPDDTLAFDQGAIPVPEMRHYSLSFSERAKPTAQELETTREAERRRTARELENVQALERQLRERDEKLAEVLDAKKGIDAELERLRSEISATKKANASAIDQHNYSEAETRDFFIDLLLREAGWTLERKEDREFEVSGMPNEEGKGFVDYVLWGDDGLPLGLVEAKRTKKSAQIGQQQAKLYADCLEKRYGRRPIIFYTNGYEHWIWDDATYPPRQVQGFFKKSELELLIQRRTSRKSLATATINTEIVERHYQSRAIRHIGEAFEQDKDRKALVVMATGAGKTRTVIALCDLLMRCNWVKRVLFLADRVALVNQAVGAFKKHLPDSSPVNLVTDKDAEGRVFVSTYPTIVGLIDDAKDTQRRFSVGHFDLIIIDEAHRSVYQKYRAIFSYFDSLLVGLTATPRDEIDRDTYGLFDLEKGVPTDVYELKDAITDKFLVPPQAVSVPLKFLREGVRYDDLSEEEKEEWDAKEWNEDGTIPIQVDPEAFNKWLFNKDTVDKVLEHVMTRGQKVAGGDVLGKTIVFAKSQKHAEFIAERFDLNYPKDKGSFARVVHCDLPYVQSIIDDFSAAKKYPHIAISVDMLDTGIDIPEVVNLVFFKLVRSKTKFWQMIGRGTRLCPDVFGLGKDKAFFYVFDYCQNLEFFSQNPETTDGALGQSLGKRLFAARLELVAEIEHRNAGAAADVRNPDMELREETTALLRTEVAAMNTDNFIVRPHRRLVETFREAAPWKILNKESVIELSREVAGLPSELDPDDEEAKRFDLLILKLQLAMLRSESSFTRLSDQVKTIVGLLAEKSAIPMVQKQIGLIEEMQTSEWWRDVTLGMLENARKRIRDLVKLIDKTARKPVYTDFEDEMGGETNIELPGIFATDTFAQFRTKALQFLKTHEDNLVVHKLRMNEPLTSTDLGELEHLLVESGVGSAIDVERAKTESHGLGIFVRSLIGMDREAAKKAFASFLDGKTLRANQIEFINLIIDHLSERGVIDASAFYSSPYTDINPLGVDGVFSQSDTTNLISIVDEIRRRAEA